MIRTSAAKLVPAFEKPYCSKCRAGHMRPVGEKCKRIPASAQLESLLERFTFEDLLGRKMLYDVQGASRRTGMTPQHIRRLCLAGTMEHIERSVGDSHQYFFLPEQLGVVFRLVRSASNTAAA